MVELKGLHLGTDLTHQQIVTLVNNNGSPGSLLLDGAYFTDETAQLAIKL